MKKNKKKKKHFWENFSSSDSDDSDKFLHKKRQAITKAVKKEEIGGVVGIPALGDMVRNR